MPSSQEESLSYGSLESLQREQETLLSGINHHQSKANDLSIRLGKVRAAVDALKGLEEVVDVHASAPEEVDLMDMVCEYGHIHGVKSPVCGNRDLFNELKSISEVRGVDFGLMLGIAYAESHIGANFAPTQECSKANNWVGLKGGRHSNGARMQTGRYPGCWLQKHESIQEGWASFANVLKYSYYPAGGTTPEMIVEPWVGKYSQRWVDAVNLFFN